ncbi:response regulator [Pseudanabaena sp. FACHB-1277]|jgi:CheY-like chemotaxis protein|uniref:Response regulator n=1 Tax=Pseudanabaena cinerea FACHB-1277 TaxID=2949581 RepID=A0A926Z6R0_9CYAN|nr:response regulator [Pseudanabaena cinerea]MBD2151068.1 response regulator [Pseudanabaena cinerea FACHB-1277]
MTQTTNYIVPIAEIIPDLNYSSLISMLNLIGKQTGIAKIKTSRFAWNIFLSGGDIAFIEERNEFFVSLKRKLKIHKLHIRPDILEILAKAPANSLETCHLLGEIYEQDRDVSLIVFKEILLENLLAIALEKNFSLEWRPWTSEPKVILPIWQLSDLENAVAKVVKQWQAFNHVRHPFQTVQLLDTECSISQIPLFAQVTNGKYRISEIADHFQQHISRTALKLDKLAENRTVAILPLPKRSPAINPRDSEQESEIISELSHRRSGSPKVMIVDDSPVLLKQFGDLLTSWGYQLILINDSAQATQKMLSEKPAVVFMDINMPNLNGFELLKQIRRQPTLAATPLVLVTSENSITNNFRAKWASCRFLSKPHTANDIKDFREQVRAVLQELAPLP